MYKKLLKVLVTGGAGFIGSEFVRQSVKKGYKIIVVDKLTYAGDLKRLAEVKNKYRFYKTDICNKVQIESIFKKEKPQAVINFAAETHVDRSIRDVGPFIETNVKGVQVLLDISVKQGIGRFIHISTDEIYGEIKKGKFYENSPLHPNNPYSASKAAADLLIKAYTRTHKLPAIIVRPCNNYGPWQYPEKLIPVIIHKALKNKKVPVYAKGLNRREWLYVADCARAIFCVLQKGKIGGTYNVGSSTEKKNIDLVKEIIRILNKPKDLINFVADRSGHDYRYALNFSKIKKLGWKPEISFKDGLESTVDWYIKNKRWLKKKEAECNSLKRG